MQYGLIGEKLGHSYSPMIHARLAGYAYELREVAPEALDTFLKARDFRGLNVTIPYKQAVLPYCSELSPIAAEVGCVNTLLVRPNGSLYGHNTDIGGFIHMLRRAGIDPKGRKAAVLGSGGTSLTARTALRHLGAREILIVSRRGPLDYEQLYASHSDVEILVNTTPVGMYPGNGASAVDISRLPHLMGVVDVVYNPEKTALILDAIERGIPATSGLPMLVAQAREAAALFSGQDISEGADEQVLAEIRSQTLNLVLIGMPGCGKSSLGEKLASALNRPLIDCDEEIVRQAGMSIPDLFDRYGEARFRELEAKLLREVCREGGRIISTGGGAILRPENIRAMRQNGRVCLIRRPLSQLPRDGRPLSASEDAVARLWTQRREKYASAADFTVDNDGTLESAAQQILEGFYEATHH